jgi:hypothetical protein
MRQSVDSLNAHWKFGMATLLTGEETMTLAFDFNTNCRRTGGADQPAWSLG